MNMDFLDPRRRRAHRRRLKIGYALMSILISIATLIFFYLAYGYDIDRSTGNLIQNGIVFVDSKPQGARIFLDDKLQSNRTDTRLVLPAGIYTIRIELDGYRHWERTFSLEGGEIERLVYPKLIPNIFLTTDVMQYDVLPGLTTQSPDRRWVLIQRPAQTYQFDVVDLNEIDRAPRSIIMPPQVLTTPGDDSAELEFVEWSTDNRHVVFKRVFDDGQKNEFIVLDIEDSSESLNINTLLGVSPKTVSLKNKRPDQIYYVEGRSNLLRQADLKDKTISAPLADGVLEYRSYGDDIVLFVTHERLAKTRAEFRVLEDGTEYILKEVDRSDHYVLDVSRYDDKYYFVVGSAVEDIVFVYQNPLDSIKPNSDKPLNVTLLRMDNPRFVSFSASTQFIGVQSGSNLLTIDLEDREQYRTELEQIIGLGYELKWMDGHRYIYTVEQQSYIVDFDGSNVQTLVTSRLSPAPFFDRDYDNVYTFEESKQNPDKKALTGTVIDKN